MMYAKSSDFLTPFPDPPCHMQKSADFVPLVCFLGSKKKPVEKIVLPSPNEGLLGGFHLWGPQKFRIFLSPHTHTLSLLKISWFCSFCLLFCDPLPLECGRHIWKPPYGKCKIPYSSSWQTEISGGKDAGNFFVTTYWECHRSTTRKSMRVANGGMVCAFKHYGARAQDGPQEVERN